MTVRAHQAKPSPDNAIDDIVAHLRMLSAADFMGSKQIAASFGQDPQNGKKIDPVVYRIDVNDIEAAAKKIKQLSEQPHRNVYMPLAIMRPDLPHGLKGGEDDILSVLGLCADFDDSNARNHAARLPMKPDCSYETSDGRFQDIYLFDRPLTFEEAKPLAQKLRDYAKCDVGTADLSHVWRIPGCWNWPNKIKVGAGRSPQPQMVKIVQPWRETFTDPAELAQALSTVELEQTSKPASTLSSRKGEPLSDKMLCDMLSRIDPGFEHLEKGHRRKAWIKIIAAIHDAPLEGDEDGSRRLEIARRWSRGDLDRSGCYKDTSPANYENDDDVDEAFRTLPPKVGGIRFGTLVKEACAAGYNGPISLANARPASEVFAGSIANVENLPQQEVVSGIPGSEDDLAMAFTQVHGRNLRYVAEWNKWLRFDGRRWVEIKTPWVWNLLRPLVRDYAAGLKDWSAAAQRKLASKGTIANVEALARGADGILIAADTLDANPLILNTTGGIVDLCTGELHESDPSAYCTKSTAVAPDADCPTPLWLAFLERITAGDMDFIKYLQREAGYCLTGTTAEHAMFCMVGPGGNGKGVFLNTLVNIWQDYAVVAAADTFAATKNDRHPTDTAMLHNARLVTAQETNHGQHWNEAKIKAITGGDRISARLMHKDFFTFTPQLKLVVATNHTPNLHNVDEAIKRRLHIIPFSVTIPENERDHDLPEKLKAEWSGILAWAIQGCIEWQRVGLKPPAAVQAATRGYFETQDSLAGWLEARCIREPQAWTARSVLYDDYAAYMHRESETPDGRSRFFERLGSHGLKQAKGGQNSFRGFAGIKLLPETSGFAQHTVTDEGVL